MATTIYGDILRLKDLGQIQRTIWEARTKWVNIGLELKLHSSDLEAIGQKFQNNPDSCFREMLTECLKKSTDKFPTWNDIAVALKKKTVSCEYLANKVEQLAKKYTVDSIIQNDEETESGLLQCACGDCTLDSYVTTGCSMSSKESGAYPYLKVEHLNESDKEDLIQTLNDGTTTIIRQFGELLVKTAKSFKAQDIDIPTLAHTALSIGPLEREQELRESKTIHEAFIVLKKHWSFYNYEILDHIIKSIGNDDDIRRLENYEEDFKVFCKRKTFEVSPNVFQDNQTGMKGRKAFMVIITDKIPLSLNDVKASTRKLATILGLRSSTLKIHRIEDGSIKILISIPEDIASEIFPLKPSQLAQLKCEGFSIVIKQDHIMRQKPTTHSDEVISRTLTAENYTTKFCKLLDCEEKTHAEILERRCDGEYTLYLHQVGLKQLPHSVSKDPKFQHVRFGFLDGLNGDKIAYAVQAAQSWKGVILYYKGFEICRADILSENYTQTDEKMYIGLDRRNDFNLQHSELHIPPSPTSCQVTVKFKLKYSYFNSLRKFLTNITEDVISKLIPKREDFDVDLRALDQHFEHCKPLCSPDQFEALMAIAHAPSRGPPILIEGPFGTGKTHILAVAVHSLFHNGILTNRFSGILVCTHHKRSTDNFLEIFSTLIRHFSLSRNVEVFLVRDYGTETTSRKVKKYCISSEKVIHHMQTHPNIKHTNFLLVTTCMSCSKLETLKGFFTHIMVDEGAQMREPEAIAPLCLADGNTKIVITGDHQQVGPSMLVLGDQARRYGLDKSLLERLSFLYQQHSLRAIATQNHLVTLSTNYRCHPAIRNFVKKLFYHDFDLRSPEVYKLPLAHPKYPKCFLFVCSSVNEDVMDVDSNINESEANALLRILKTIAFFNWPTEWGIRNLFNCCIMSPSRNQLTIINQTIKDWNKKFSMLKPVCRRPTYDIQGREFRAVFLSTSEPIANGRVLNPTKSFSNRFVFNTAITRAQSLVVGVGNPFLLLKMEKHMIQTYGYKEQGKCWSTFFKECLSTESIKFDNSLGLKKDQQDEILKKLQRAVDKQIQQDCSTDNAPLPMKDGVLLSREFPPIPVHKKHKKRKRNRKRKKNKNTVEETEKEQSGVMELSEIVPEVKKKKDLAVTLATAPTFSRFKEEFDVIKDLGEGEYATEFHVVSTSDHSKEYMIKLIPLPTSKHRSETMEKQARIITQMDHPHLIKCHGYWIEHGWPVKTLLQESALQSEVLMTQLELPGSTVYTLEDWLKQHTEKRLKTTVVNFFEQMLDVLSYVSQYSHLSIQLTPCNIFLDSTKDNFLKVGSTGLITGHSSRYIDDTSCYMSPEQKQVKDGGTKADSYSLGVIFFEMHCHFTSKEDRNQVLTQLKQDGIPSIFRNGMHSEVASIIQLLLNQNPDMRPSAKEIIEDRYKYLKNLKKKIQKSESVYIPVLSLVKTKRKCTSKIPKEHITILLDHLVEDQASFQIDCPVCKDITKLPYQVDCCGKVFCQNCIERAQKESPDCPMCKEKDYVVHQDKALQKALENVMVHCPCTTDCDWTGKVKHLDDHFNQSPTPQRQLEGCQFVKIQCLYCLEKFVRSSIDVHQSTQCPMRPFSCQYCRNYTSNYKDIEENHWPECKDFLIKCEMKCGEMVPRKDYVNHIEKQCMEVEENCTYCNSVVQRKNMLSHVIDMHVSQNLQKQVRHASQLQAQAYERKHSIQQKKQMMRSGCKSLHKVKQATNNKSGRGVTLSSQKIRSTNICRDTTYSNTRSNQPTVKSLIQPPPEPFRDLIECPLCLHIAKEPHQLLCCGKNICKQCIDKIKNSKEEEKCPWCKGTIDSFFNKGLLHALSEVYTHCPYKDKGCKWNGTLGDLDTHLKPDCQTKGCEYEEIMCTDCGSTYERHHDNEHKLNSCSERIVTCKYCKLYRGRFSDVTTNHLHICENFLLECPRKCGTFIERQHLRHHLHKKCPLRKHTQWVGVSYATFRWFLLMLLNLTPLLLLILLLPIYDHSPQELAVQGLKVNEICHKWKINSMIVTLTYSKTTLRQASMITYDVTCVNAEWNEEFEFCTKSTIVSTDELHERKDRPFNGIRALQQAIQTKKTWSQYNKN